MPARLLTFSAKRGRVVERFEVNWSLLHPDGVSLMGDGMFESQRLGPASYLDLFVYDPTETEYGIHGPGPIQIQPLPRGHVLKLNVLWAEAEGSQIAEARLIWGSNELRSGRGPRIALGTAVKAVDRFTEMFDRQISSEVLGIRRRVRNMNWLDVRERRRREEQRRAMTPDVVTPPHVRSISLEGLRGFRSPGRLTLAQPKAGIAGSGLTIVVGANNAGKSTLWEAFDAIARKRKGEVSFSEGQRNQGSAHGVRIELEYGDGSMFTVKSIDPESSETVAEWNSEASVRLADSRIVVLPSRRYFRSSFHRGGTGQPDWMVGGGMGFTRFQERDSFTGRLFALHEDRAKKTMFDDLLGRVVGYRVDWKIELSDNQNGASHYLKIKVGDGVNHSSEGLGDGIISLIFILDALYDTDSRELLVIDEPELSLHPQLVRRLRRELSQAAAERQIVLFTHSPQMVSWDDIEAGAEIARVYKVGGESLVAQPPRSVISEVSKVRRGWKNPHVLGTDANEALFLDDGVVVVEGQEDAALLPTVFEQVGLEPRGNVFGWGSGGGDGGPRRIVGLLAALGFKRVVALLDADKSREVEAIRKEFPGYLATTIPADDIRDKPAVKYEGKAGLLDEKTTMIKPGLKSPTRAVLTSVVEYLSA